MVVELNLKPYQIVCIEHQNSRLYSEVIQVVEKRQLCWLRPLVLIDVSDQDSHFLDAIDLRQGSDLFLPLSLLRAALDTETIPILVQLEQEKDNFENLSTIRFQLNQFVKKIWLANPNLFQDN